METKEAIAVQCKPPLLSYSSNYMDNMDADMYEYSSKYAEHQIPSSIIPSNFYGEKKSTMWTSTPLDSGYNNSLLESKYAYEYELYPENFSQSEFDLKSSSLNKLTPDNTFSEAKYWGNRASTNSIYIDTNPEVAKIGVQSDKKVSSVANRTFFQNLYKKDAWDCAASKKVFMKNNSNDSEYEASASNEDPGSVSLNLSRKRRLLRSNNLLKNARDPIKASEVVNQKWSENLAAQIPEIEFDYSSKILKERFSDNADSYLIQSNPESYLFEDHKWKKEEIDAVIHSLRYFGKDFSIMARSYLKYVSEIFQIPKKSVSETVAFYYLNRKSFSRFVKVSKIEKCNREKRRLKFMEANEMS